MASSFSLPVPLLCGDIEPQGLAVPHDRQRRTGLQVAREVLAEFAYPNLDRFHIAYSLYTFLDFLPLTYRSKEKNRLVRRPDEDRGTFYGFEFRASQELMEHDRLQAVNQCIRDAAQQAAAPAGLSAMLIERFLRTGEATWEGAGSGRFSLAQFKEDEAYTRATKTAIRNLLDLLANLLPAKTQSSPAVPPEMIQQRIEPMVSGLVPGDWREVALREITARTFVLNLPGTRAAIEAELSTCFMGDAWRVLWALFGDHGLKPDDIKVGCDGLAGDYAHVRWSAYQTKDPYSDVVVHEAAHMLHYLKPSHYGLRVRRGQERFVDIEFRHRELFAYACEAYSRVVLQGERKLRTAFAEQMVDAAFSFPRGQIEAIGGLVLSAARARNGWRVIREATVIHGTRRRAKTISSARPVSE